MNVFAEALRIAHEADLRYAKEQAACPVQVEHHTLNGIRREAVEVRLQVGEILYHLDARSLQPTWDEPGRWYGRYWVGTPSEYERVDATVAAYLAPIAQLTADGLRPVL